jgi:hypothetical protein
MRPRKLSRLLSAFLLCGAVLLPAWAAACTVPVFRYALEHWAADPYQAVVVHRGPLTPEQQTLLKELRPEGLKANIAVRTLDLDTARSEDLAPLPRGTTAGALPRLVLLTPKTAQFPGVIWAGELSAENMRGLVDSPARQKIAERLGEGQSAVWVLLESENRAQSDAAAKLLEERLAYLDSVLTLPKLDPQDIVNGLVSVGQDDLHLEFSVLRLSRADPAERVFIQTLLGTEPDLRDLAEPMAFPIFGQGRALYALVGAGLKHETIDKAATFLIGRERTAMHDDGLVWIGGPMLQRIAEDRHRTRSHPGGQEHRPA